MTIYKEKLHFGLITNLEARHSLRSRFITQLGTFSYVDQLRIYFTRGVQPTTYTSTWVNRKRCNSDRNTAEYETAN